MFGNPIFRLILITLAFGRRMPHEKGSLFHLRSIAYYLPGRLIPEQFAYAAMLVSDSKLKSDFLLTFGEFKVFSLLDRYSTGARVVHPWTYDNYGWVFESVMEAIRGMKDDVKAEFDRLCEELWSAATSHVPVPESSDKKSAGPTTR